MQRDVKVGLVLGVFLVAVVAVVFFRKDDADKQKFTKLLPAPDAVAEKARDVLGPSPSEPYHVAPEYLPDSWQSKTAAKTPKQPLVKRAESAAEPKTSEVKSDSGRAAILLPPPELGTHKPLARGKTEAAENQNKPAIAIVNNRSNPGTGEYTIQDGDTLSDIAIRTMGQASLYPLIYEANRDVLSDPERIPVGQRIRIPDLHKNEGTRKPESQAVRPAPTQATRASKPTPSGETYRVKDGDSLYGIARQMYHKESMYLEILEANRDQLEKPGDLRSGMVLKLPQ